MTIELRPGTMEDAPAIHALISANVNGGHLLPRSFDDIETHTGRFMVAVSGPDVIGCAELAPLSEHAAEVRSLVVAEACRGRHTGASLVSALADRARSLGYLTLCAFTHQPSHFVRLGFSLVPHVWVPEKIAHDCVACPLFRQCGQYAVSLTLRAGAGLRLTENFAPAARTVAPRRASVERLRLIPAEVWAAGTQPAHGAAHEGAERGTGVPASDRAGVWGAATSAAHGAAREGAERGVGVPASDRAGVWGGAPSNRERVPA